MCQTRVSSIYIVGLALALLAGEAGAQTGHSGRNVQITVEFRSAKFVRQGELQSTHQSSQSQMLVVSDGLEGRLFIGKQTPYVTYYRDYLRQEGYLTGEIVFRDVGSSLLVRPRVVGANVEITLTPEVSYETGDGTGSIAVTKLSTTVMVPSGQSIEVGSGRSQFEDNFYTQGGEAVQIVLTPHVL